MTTALLHTDVRRSRFARHIGAIFKGSMKPLARDASIPAARDAQKVRDMARAYAKTDPGFASDLYAAAARHEG